MLPHQRDRAMAHLGLGLLTTATILVIVIAASDGSLAAKPATFSALLADTSSIRYRMFAPMGSLAAICVLISWATCLPPYSTIELFRQGCLITGLVIIASIPTAPGPFARLSADDIWAFVIHNIGGTMAFAVHPALELLSYWRYQASIDQRCCSGECHVLTELHQYRPSEDRYHLRVWLAISCLLLASLFMTLLLINSFDPSESLSVICFCLECSLIAMLLADAWLIATVVDRL